MFVPSGRGLEGHGLTIRRTKSGTGRGERTVACAVRGHGCGGRSTVHPQLSVRNVAGGLAATVCEVEWDRSAVMDAGWRDDASFLASDFGNRRWHRVAGMYVPVVQ